MKQNMHLLLYFLIMSAIIFEVNSNKCEIHSYDLITTEQTKPSTDKYYLTISDDIEKYVPETRYIVTIKGDAFRYGHPKFKRFVIALESKVSLDDNEIIPQTGSFELGDDGHSRFSDRCKDTVIEANTQSKHQVTLIWKAPPTNSGCISMRATIIETRERWYETDEYRSNGPLAKMFCEDFNENEDEQPQIEKVCCACGDAKYEVGFEGKWIRNMHPKGFPEDIWTTRFSYIIGYSHKFNHAFWKGGTEPSEGMKELAFNGSTKTLETELFSNAANARTIFRTSGLVYPQITSTSYTTIRVDSVNHLVTLVSKMTPSPDWIVGVSSMELCLSNCSWRQSRSLNLYPWDVGIDDALEYTSTEPSSNSHPIITKITSSRPSDSRSPFYDPSGDKMNPIATVHFKLKKVNGECNPERNQEIEEEEDNDEEPVSQTRGRRSCDVTGWSRWSTCSVECGRGHKTRNVVFKHNRDTNDCFDIKKEETKECTEQCDSGEEEKDICSGHKWSPWSECSVSCGKGKKQRFRIPSETYNEEETTRVCPHKEEVECFESDC